MKTRIPVGILEMMIVLKQ